MQCYVGGEGPPVQNTIRQWRLSNGVRVRVPQDFIRLKSEVINKGKVHLLTGYEGTQRE
jgi:hypothetical protein